MMTEAIRIGPSSTLLHVRAVYRFPPFWVNLASDRGDRSGEVIVTIRQPWERSVVCSRAVQQKRLPLLKEREPA